MPFFDRVKKIVTPKDKRKEKKEGEEGEEKRGGVEARVLKQPKKKKRLAGGGLPFAKSGIGDADRVIISPLISEKATDLTSRGQYVFKVTNDANKVEVKKAIAKLYGVTVIGTRMVSIPRKKRRLGKSRGYKAGYKKAIVQVKRGEKIEILSQ